MCSVVGCVGTGQTRVKVVEGLSRLEYRGYDSAGFACLDPQNHRIMYAKATGRLDNLKKELESEPIDGPLGIGHTRWSTHGASSRENAHPQFDCHKTIAIVHNGIVENHHELRRHLEETGHVFHSETDTEVISHLLESSLATHKQLKRVVVDVVKRCAGAYAFVGLFQDHPDCLIAVRRRSPLCIGVGDDQMYIASDVLAFAGMTNQVLFIPDDSFAIVRADSIELYSFAGDPLPLEVQEVDVSWNDCKHVGYDHYMLKEIYEQKTAIHDTVDLLEHLSSSVWDHLNVSVEQIKDLETLNLIGCGTSWHAARIAQFFFEQIALLPTRALLASEFRHMPFFPQQQSLYLAISQSGETADTLEALRLVNDMQLPTAVLTNVASSTMVREAGGFLLTDAKTEIAVASTKAFSTQLAALYWLAHRIARERGVINSRQMEAAVEDLLVVAEVLEDSIERYKNEIISTIAARYASCDRAIFLGRHISYPFALEAALKLKEVAYVFAQAYPAGELKHGALALVDERTPVFVFSCQEPIVYQKLLSNVQEAKARGAHVIVFCFEGQDELAQLGDTAFVIANNKPLLGPLSMAGLVQFLVYSIAWQLDRPIDKPRNLAKAVTVE